MHIKRVRVNNFKSFSNLDIQFNNLNFFVGANASGKSNFINIFQFLRNIAQHGLDNAISIEGGVDYLRNVNLGAEQNLTVSMTYLPTHPNTAHTVVQKNFIASKISEAEYRFTLEFDHSKQGFSIVDDKLRFRYEFFEATQVKNGVKQKSVLGQGEGTLAVNGNGLIEPRINIPPDIDLSLGDLLPTFEAKLKPKRLLLESPIFDLAHKFDSPFENIAIYDFDPKLPKRAASITGLKELEENGNNLAIVLKNIIENKETKRKFLNLLDDILSFVDDFKVQRLADKSILFMMREAYNSQAEYIPATFISDGTINVVALIIALYFEEKTPVIFEEPERNIHPHLISNLVNMFTEVSTEKQVIVTTHNPEIVRYAEVQDLFLVARNAEGFSTVCKPSDNQAIQTFLDNEIGLEELYIQDLLGLASAG